MTDTTICLLILIIAIIFSISFNLRLKRDRRRSEAEKDHDGDIFINDYGEIYAQFDIPIDEIVKSDKLVMKVHHIKNKER